MANGKQKLIEQFLTDGITYMFGNPGTVEQGFLDILQDYEDFHYITCLHESVAVAMADGYTRKTKHPALIQLHSGVGLGNGIGMLYQAYRGHSPLIVIAGEAGVKYSSMDTQMACDLVQMAKPVTKFAERVVHPDSLLRLVRKAIKMAMTPPCGPVFLCLPMDILDAENHENVFPSCRLDMSSSPEEEAVNEIAQGLRTAKNPCILAGDGVNEANAIQELEAIAELLGAPVWGVNTSSLNISQNHPLYQGDMGHMFGTNSTDIMKAYDAVLIVGTYIFPEVFPSLESPFPVGTKVYHIDLDAYEIAKNHPVDKGIVAHPKKALSMLQQQLAVSITKDDQHLIDQRKAQYHKEVKPLMDGSIAAAFFQELSKYVDEKTIIFDEALTASSYVTSFLPRKDDGTFFQTRGGSLGVGIPGAMGIQLAEPDATVLAFTGDGGSLYTIQALYTAMRYHLPIKVVICCNDTYGLLESNINVYWKEEHIIPHEYPDCFSLKPSIDFVQLAQSMGIEAIRVDTIEKASESATLFMSNHKPMLVELNTKKNIN